ncbi:hypothetical protein [Duganella violaceipulchra]|uniref:Uncharacterized protein n=1 Tax=Duganella violaceipulchra TaxID=2849652 RepID=A0AA41HCP9_9BURK|nr:hypothetical protein [Duganella violaceicalia]MBV6324884.1 hypothetical protein [Duganella violaceicalia]MCP2012368.1 hypothetical protein [Duganella violaceicalia]
MNPFSLIDYRDEFYLKTFRRWNVVNNLSRNAKFKGGVPLHKAALVDFLLCNPPLLQRILVHFGRAEPSLNLEELLYQNNLEFGGAQDIGDFCQTCVLLISEKYLEFRKIDGEILLIGSEDKLSLDNYLSQRWEKEIDLLQPLLGKSLNILSNAVLGRF